MHVHTEQELVNLNNVHVHALQVCMTVLNHVHTVLTYLFVCNI